MSRAGLDKDPHEVAEMFDGVAKGYDLTNSVMTLGFDRRWREWTRRALDARAGEKILDLAAGTAVSTVEYSSAGAWCVAADFSLGMLRAGAAPPRAQDRRRRPAPALRRRLLRRRHRLLRPAQLPGHRGRPPRDRPRRAPRRPPRHLRAVQAHLEAPAPLYSNVALRFLPVIAKPVASNTDAYSYLADSIRDWHDQRTLAELIAEAGWDDVAWMNLTAGMAAIHRATKPA